MWRRHVLVQSLQRSTPGRSCSRTVSLHWERIGQELYFEIYKYEKELYGDLAIVLMSSPMTETLSKWTPRFLKPPARKWVFVSWTWRWTKWLLLWLFWRGVEQDDCHIILTLLDPSIFHPRWLLCQLSFSLSFSQDINLKHLKSSPPIMAPGFRFFVCRRVDITFSHTPSPPKTKTIFS